MKSLPCTTIAGRHAADLQRARAGLEAAQAREALARMLRERELPVFTDFNSLSNAEPSLAVNCRLATGRADHDLIYAILDAQGWRPNPARMSRMNDRYDVLRVVQEATGATVVLVIKLPYGHAEEWEAA